MAEHESENVHSLDYAIPKHAPRLVVLGRYPLMQAELIRIRLNNEGIRASVGDQATAALYQTIGTLGEAKVLVFEDDIDRAKEILAKPVALNHEDRDENDGYVEESWRCPRCHGKDVGVHPMELWEIVFCVITLWFGSIFLKRSQQCRKCGHQWKR